MRKLKIKKRNHFCPWPFTWCLYKIARNDVVEGGRIPPLGRFLDFDSLKAHADGCNKCQQLPTLLRVVGQHCCVRLQLGLTLDRFQTIRNKCQQVPTLLWFHAKERNKSQHCWAQQCWVLLANDVGSVCIGLKGPFPGSLRQSDRMFASPNLLVIF